MDKSLPYGTGAAGHALGTGFTQTAVHQVEEHPVHDVLLSLHDVLLFHILLNNTCDKHYMNVTNQKLLIYRSAHRCHLTTAQPPLQNQAGEQRCERLARGGKHHRGCCCAAVHEACSVACKPPWLTCLQRVLLPRWQELQKLKGRCRGLITHLRNAAGTIRGPVGQ